MESWIWMGLLAFAMPSITFVLALAIAEVLTYRRMAETKARYNELMGAL